MDEFETVATGQADTERPQSARDEFIGGLAERARKERDELLEKHGHAPIDTLNVTDDQAQPDDVGVVADTQPDATPQPEKVRIKVDGVEMEVERDKVLDAGIRAMQKESAADKRLQEATELLRRAEETAKMSKESGAHAEVNLPQQWDDQSVAWILENGTDEEKAAAIGQIRGRNNATPEYIANKAAELAIDRLDFETERARFVQEYDDIVKDPYLLQLAIADEDKALASGDKRPRRELYKEIGDSIRAWKGGLSGGNTSAMEDKRTAKAANIVNIPAASSKSTATEQKKPRTTAQIIDDMRRSRGNR